MDRPAGPESTKSFGFSGVSAAAGSRWAEANRDRLRVQGRERVLSAPGTVRVGLNRGWDSQQIEPPRHDYSMCSASTSENIALRKRM